jgi:cell wall-associated NlpC family hydrolase
VRRAGRRRVSWALRVLAVAVSLIGVTIAVALLALLITPPASNACSPSSSGSSGTSIVLGPPGTGQMVGATEYGGPGDPSSGTVGASGANLVQHPDSYAELGGYTFQTANDLGGLAYGTPLRITWGGHSAIAYKRDFGFGGGPIDGLPRVIDLWWEFAGALHIPYENGLWSGPVRIERPPATGSSGVLGQTPADAAPASTAGQTGTPASCSTASGAGVPLTGGSQARLLSNGLAAAPANAPAAVKGIIAAGNQIVGKPYVYGGGHGIPLSQVAPSYDCSSSVEHLLWGGGLLPASYDAASGTLESFGQPGVGRWVTLYASADHVFMYVAGIRWDTWNAAGPGDGTTGIGWHPLIRSSAGFVARHPTGL